MESKRHDRGRLESESPPVQHLQSSSPFNTAQSELTIHKNRVNSRGSPSLTDHRSGRSSRNVSPQDKSRRKRRRRSRSSERSRKHSRRPRSRSRSRGGKSRSRERKRSGSFNRSASRSLSRSRTYSCSRSRSRSNSRSKSRSCNRNRDSHRSRHRDSRRYRHHHHNRHYRGASYESDNVGDIGGIDRHKNSQNNKPIVPPQSNAFKNDGSFMEMFKKMQESMQQPSIEKPTTSVLEEKPVAPPPLMVGKRRGGRILKTGMVAKPKAGQTVDQPKDAWSLYMAEVKKYREVCCQEEDNTRPLVK